jgi:hypothetical protein
MTSLTHFFRESLRSNFGPTVFFIISGVIAAAFIGYLIYDSIRIAAENARRRKLHSHERQTHSH